MKLKLLSSTTVLKILSKQGFQVIRQKGSHISLYKKVDNKSCLVIVPKKKQIKKGTLLSIIKQAGMTKDTFLKLV